MYILPNYKYMLLSGFMSIKIPVFIDTFLSSIHLGM